MKLLSRRKILSLASVVPTALSCGLDKPQSCLLQLGNRFDALSADFDKATETGGDVDWMTLTNLDGVTTDIAAKPAVTIDELTVKAKVACWARLGDLNFEADSTIDHRMALSIIQDLIRHEFPWLEKPGALKKLTET